MTNPPPEAELAAKWWGEQLRSRLDIQDTAGIADFVAHLTKRLTLAMGFPKFCIDLVATPEKISPAILDAANDARIARHLRKIEVPMLNRNSPGEVLVSVGPWPTPCENLLTPPASPPPLTAPPSNL